MSSINYSLCEKKVSYKNVNLCKVADIVSYIPIISLEQIEKMVNIDELRELETKYDEFLQKKYQILLLSNVQNIELYLDIRDALIVRIIKVDLEMRRVKRLRFYGASLCAPF